MPLVNQHVLLTDAEIGERNHVFSFRKAGSEVPLKIKVEKKN